MQHPHLQSESLHHAVVCGSCARSSLVADEQSAPSSCPACGGKCVSVPGVRFARADLALFAQLESVVQTAQLSRGEAALIGAELESVGGRWEAPELVLQRISARLRGLAGIYDREQEYSTLLSVVQMLLTIVCARMNSTGAAPRRSRPWSGVYRAVVDGTETQRGSALRRTSG